MKNSKPLTGILPAPITPFAEDGSVDYGLFEKQIAYLVEAGVHGIFAGGTTGEGALLSSDERVSLFRIVKELTTDDHLRCVVIIRPDTRAVLRGLEEIAAEEPDYVSAVTPYYMAARQSEIITHYTEIADSSPAPVLLYNIPQNTHNPMTLETVLELAGHPNIAGIKDSSGNFMQLQHGILGGRTEGFTWIQGEDLLDAPSFMLGIRCIVTGLSNAWAEPYVKMFEAVKAGDHEAVLEQQRRINRLAAIIPAAGGNVIAAIKAVATAAGRVSNEMRIPGMRLSGEENRAVVKIAAELGLV